MARVHWDVTERIRIIRHLDFTRPTGSRRPTSSTPRSCARSSSSKADQAQLLLKTHIEQSKAEVRKITLHTLQAARERAAR